jgi:uncharacterized oxidoreductase
MPTFSTGELTDFATRLLRVGGAGADEARRVAESLVGANLRGHDSHGVMRIPYYIDQVQKGEIVPGAALTVLRESDVLLVADGGWGFGQVQAARLTERLMVKAEKSGVALGTMFKSAHVGRLGEYCEQAAAKGLVSLWMVNTHGTARRVAPPGGTSPRLGTNPLAFGVPNGNELLLLDFGTSATAEGKVRVKRIAGQQCPDGWLLDSGGRPTKDPNVLYQDPPGSILPMGGSQAYKGFGLALMVEVFAGALSGGVCAREVPKNQVGNCAFALVVDPSHLGGEDHFAREVRELAQFVRSSPVASGQGGIQLPGDPERNLFAERSRQGIPLDDGNWRALADRAKKLGVSSPSESAPLP